jgi:hypothetical protein
MSSHSFWHKIILIKKPPYILLKNFSKQKNSSSLCGGDVMGKHSKTFFSQNLQIFKIDVIYPLDVSLQSTAAPPKTTKLILSFIHSLWRHTS